MGGAVEEFLGSVERGGVLLFGVVGGHSSSTWALPKVAPKAGDRWKKAIHFVMCANRWKNIVKYCKSFKSRPTSTQYSLIPSSSKQMFTFIKNSNELTLSMKLASKGGNGGCGSGDSSNGINGSNNDVNAIVLAMIIEASARSENRLTGLKNYKTLLKELKSKESKCIVIKVSEGKTKIMVRVTGFREKLTASIIQNFDRFCVGVH